MFLAAGSSLSLFGLPLASGEKIAQNAILSDGVFSLSDHIGLTIAFAGAGVLALIAIFLFKNRPLQSRLARLSILFIIAGIGFSAYLLFSQSGNTINALGISAGTFLPIVAIILTVLANRSIKKDENLVRSMDRLR